MAATQEYASNMTSAGQLILPQEVRRALGLKTQGKVVFRVTDEKVEVLSESAAKEPTPSTAQQVLSSLPAFAAKPKTTAKAKPKAKAKAKTKAKPKSTAKAKPKAAAKPKKATTSKPKTTAKPKSTAKTKAAA